MPTQAEIVSRLGFGCGRLVGGSSLVESAKLVEAALGLGVRYFDVAPSYGLGTAEDVLGVVLSGVKDVQITTKVGIGRPTGGQNLSMLRKYLGPVLKSSHILKALALKVLSKQVKRGMFNVSDVAFSLEDSLTRLKSDKIDCLLLHEATKNDITDELLSYCQNLIGEQKVKQLGLGYNCSLAQIDKSISFGTVLQHHIGNICDTTINDGRIHIVHGVLRSGNDQLASLLMDQNSFLAKQFKILDWDIGQSRLLGVALLGLALMREGNNKVLVSFSSVNTMIETIELARLFICSFDEMPDFN